MIAGGDAALDFSLDLMRVNGDANSVSACILGLPKFGSRSLKRSTPWMKRYAALRGQCPSAPAT
jgi:hypothetical protein